MSLGRSTKKKTRSYKRSAKRYYKQKRNRYVNKIPIGKGPVAPKTLVRLKYCELYDITIAAGLVTDQVFNLNSIFDPNRSGTGHQPYGHDTYQTLYNRYRVYAMSWRIEFPATSESASIAVLPSNSAVAFSDISLASESPRAISKTLSYNGGQRCIFRGKIYLPSLNGSTTQQYMSDDRFQATFGTNPSELMALHVVMCNTSHTSISLRPTVTLVYHCELFDPLELSQS